MNSNLITEENLLKLKELKTLTHVEEFNPLLIKAQHYFLSQKTNPKKQVIIKSEGEMLNIESSIENLDRALRIMETLIRNIEKLGGKVVIGRHKYNSAIKCTYVILFEEKIEISLKEQLGNKKHVPTEDELKRQKKNQWFKPPEFDPAPSNNFILEIETFTKKGGQRKWQDNPNKSLDDQVGKFIIGLIKISPTVKQERLENEERGRKQKEEEDRIKNEKERVEEELRRIKVLDYHLGMFSKLRWINEYLTELENSIDLAQLTEEERKVANNWIDWVKKYRNQINLFRPENYLYFNGLPNELNESQSKQTHQTYGYSGQPKEPEKKFGWWDRPPWKW